MNMNYQIRRNNIIPRTGSLLISEPLLQGPYFQRSVVLIIGHSNHEGTVGVVLNKSISTDLNNFLPSVIDFNPYMFVGGPVNLFSIYFLHTLGAIIEDSIEIVEGLYWGGNIETVNKLSELKILNDQNIRFFLGYAGWQAGQLEDELDENNWAVLEPDNIDFFKVPSAFLWEYTVSKLGDDYKFWASLPYDPMLN